MKERADQIANWDLTKLTEEVKRADQLADQARKELEAVEVTLKTARSKYMAAQEYQTIIRDFTKALLSTRDPKAQERIRSKYQKKLANFQDLASRSEAKTASRKEVEKNISNLMALVEKAAADIATKLKGGEADDANKDAAATVVEQGKKNNGDDEAGEDLASQPA